eukprot:TRINITY_DN5996_c0_g1_i2.p1 TRINITY_DN5996_c0_g1~~TRINITY_DN5996_c0_g1_i2.p1  ORF type:complete len:218 (-),score=45.88 TRINITY_DN5996_c0_g1_i2:303-956(-)
MLLSHKKHSDEELANLAQQTFVSKKEVIEAVNHLQVVRLMIQTFIVSKQKFTEEKLKDLHEHLMNGLLRDDQAGHYRNCEIYVTGSPTRRSLAKNVPADMTSFFKTLEEGRKKNEALPFFLSRIHSLFQKIHPFRDGNGRMGRIVMNIISTQMGYPIIYYSPDHRLLFSNACESAHQGEHWLFSRMIVEAYYVALRQYETITGPLLPNVIDEDHNVQ